MNHLHAYVSDSIDPYGTGIFHVQIPNTCRCASCGRKKKDGKDVQKNWDRYQAWLTMQEEA